MVDKNLKIEKSKEERLQLMNTVKELIEINKIPKIPFKDIIVKKKVGEGGQAKVYLGEYKNLEVAVKILQDIDHKCLAHEIVIISNLKSECIPNFYGLVVEEDMIGFVTKLIDGKPLDEYKFIDFDEALKFKIMIKLASTLKYLHENTFVHRDLKPENMMLDSKYNFYLIDFGIAKVMTNMIDTLTRAKGTIYYLAPETLEVAELTEQDEIISKITNKVDVWAFGCIMSYLFSGILPWISKYADQASVIQKLLLKKAEFPIPETQIKERNYKNYDLIVSIIKECTIPDAEKRISMKSLLENYFSKLVL
jgi:serine/threonine protein kinase